MNNKIDPFSRVIQLCQSCVDVINLDTLFFIPMHVTSFIGKKLDGNPICLHKWEI